MQLFLKLLLTITLKQTNVNHIWPHWSLPLFLLKTFDEKKLTIYHKTKVIILKALNMKNCPRQTNVTTTGHTEMYPFSSLNYLLYHQSKVLHLSKPKHKIYRIKCNHIWSHWNVSQFLFLLNNFWNKGISYTWLATSIIQQYH